MDGKAQDMVVFLCVALNTIHNNTNENSSIYTAMLLEFTFKEIVTNNLCRQK